MPQKYVVNNKLTPDALLMMDFLAECNFQVGDPSPVRLGDDSKDDFEGRDKKQHYQRFVEFTYPDSTKSSSMIVPNCAMHHNIHDYYGEPNIFVRVPQA